MKQLFFLIITTCLFQQKQERHVHVWQVKEMMIYATDPPIYETIFKCKKCKKDTSVSGQRLWIDDTTKVLREMGYEINTGKNDSMKWINSNDRLPEHWGSVLAITNTGRYRITWIDRGTKQFDNHEINEEEFFTHWMPLPEPPKK